MKNNTLFIFIIIIGFFSLGNCNIWDNIFSNVEGPHIAFPQDFKVTFALNRNLMESLYRFDLYWIFKYAFKDLITLLDSSPCLRSLEPSIENLVGYRIEAAQVVALPPKKTPPPHEPATATIIIRSIGFSDLNLLPNDINITQTTRLLFSTGKGTYECQQYRNKYYG